MKKYFILLKRFLNKASEALKRCVRRLPQWMAMRARGAERRYKEGEP